MVSQPTHRRLTRSPLNQAGTGGTRIASTSLPSPTASGDRFDRPEIRYSFPQERAGGRLVRVHDPNPGALLPLLSGPMSQFPNGGRGHPRGGVEHRECPARCRHVQVRAGTSPRGVECQFGIDVARGCLGRDNPAVVVRVSCPVTGTARPWSSRLNAWRKARITGTSHVRAKSCDVVRLSTDQPSRSRVSVAVGENHRTK
jgi:hypothetical protein